ncbi:MAG TPA: hypothetical protein VGJ55_05430 [Pyrinomonadaceae bacterium]
MPKDPKRNIPNYQLQGGHLNEFEFQKSQGEMAEESELPFTDEADKANLDQVKRIARVAAEAHRKVEKRKKHRAVSAGGRQRIVPDKRSAKKSTRKPAKKITTGPRTKTRANVKSGR